MKFLIALLSILALSSCNNQTVYGSREKLKHTRDDKTFTMTVELIDADKITEHCSNLGVPYEANGCTAFNLDTKHCTIYVSGQRFTHDEERLTIIGHETWHCRFGEWHD
jgi:hypothetical protein